MGIVKRLMDAARRFTAWDFAYFKLCLLSLGIILGAYLSCFFLKYISVIWAVFIVTWIIMIVQVVKYLKKPKD